MKYGNKLIGFIIIVGIGVLLYKGVNWNSLLNLDFYVIYKFRYALLKGLGLTVLITAVSVIVGLVMGVVQAIICLSPITILRWVVSANVEIWRNTPLIVQLFWVHFAFPMITGINTSVFVSGILAITLQASAYLTEIARAGIKAIPKGQWEAAYALGLPTTTRWLHIILPQAAKIMIPPLANTAMSFYKASAILSVLSVGELMSVSQHIVTYSMKPIEIFTAIGIIYFIIGSIFSNGTYKLETILKKQGR